MGWGGGGGGLGVAVIVNRLWLRYNNLDSTFSSLSETGIYTVYSFCMAVVVFSLLVAWIIRFEFSYRGLGRIPVMSENQ